MSTKTQIKAIDERIEELTTDLVTVDSYSEEYKAIVTNIETLVKVRKELNSGRPFTIGTNIDMNAIITGAIGLAAVLMITKYEENEIVTSKAFGLVSKWIGK